MKIKITLLLFLVVLISCESTDQPDANVAILPKPLEMALNSGYSKVQDISIQEGSDIVLSHIDFVTKAANPNLFLESNETISQGAYELNVLKDKIELSYGDLAGVNHALATLRQLRILNGNQLPLLSIKDEPEFKYRGMHLDVARHFYSVAEVKKFIDYLAFYKFNYFHWHLTDDQGWRIEIKKYPKLHEIGAWRSETLVGHYSDEPHQFDGKRYGGYYTQDQIKEVVNYALARSIQVIPEIDIPGHSTALLTAYPEFGCEDKIYDSATKWGVFFDILCPKEETFDFLEDVFTEVAELFPAKYIHIGGDECPKEQWDENAFCQALIKKENLKDAFGLQSYFIRRVEKFLNSQGKSIIGWDEILEGGLAPNATVMSWRGINGGIEAAKEGHDVIMTPTSHCYFDYYQSENEKEPLAIGGFIPFQKVYNYNPIPEELSENEAKHVLGAQGNIWSEYLPKFSDVEYQGLVRMITLAEVVWGKNTNSIEKYSANLFDHTAYWKQQGANIASHLLDVKTKLTLNPNTGVEVSAASSLEGSQLFYLSPDTSDFVSISEAPMALTKAGKHVFYSELNGLQGTKQSIIFKPHLGNSGNILLDHTPAEKYSGQGAQSLINGIEGPTDRYGGSEWLGFEGDDFEALISFDEVQKMRSIKLKFFKGEGQWIYLPKEILVFKIRDNGKKSLLARSQKIESDSKVAYVKLNWRPTKVSKLRIEVKNYGLIPDGKQGSGNLSWLFVDEIVLN